VVALAALGYREAASLVLEDLRKKERELPGLETFVSVERRALQSGGMARLGGRYTVRRLLGSGGMGRVYLARDEISGHDVAVKVVAAPQDARLRQGYDRFVREARVVSALKHPNLVGVVAFHETQGLLAMEYMAGGTLADRLPGPLPPALVRSLLVSLTSGLEAAHGHGVIHRDIKPQNVFFTQTGEAKLGDFGVAHLQDLGATQTAGFIGTLAYMSPEQISGAPLTFACDIYALGCTAYQALTGRLPFLGPDFVGQHLGEAAPPPTALNRALDPAWDALIARAMAKDPRDRFASLEELRRALAPIGAEPGAKRGAEPSPEGATAEARGPAQPRYAVGGSLGAGARGELLHATDTRLGREVVLERIPAEALEGEAGGALLAWLRALARHGGPRLQRILRLERLADGSLQAVFEAATGTPRPLETLSHAEAAELAAALAPLHAEGFAHGSLEGSIVSSALGPTLVCAGRAPTGVTPAQERALLNGAPRAR
jgi:serine/threonine-protein kinase